MNTKDFIDELFKDYEETEELLELKQEINTNLSEKINYYVKNGSSKDEAFKKATEELEDISKIADENSFKKREHIIQEMYLGERKFLTKPLIAGYVVFPCFLFFGMLLAVIGIFNRDFQMSVGVLLPFGIIPICGLVYLVLRTETAYKVPMKKLRSFAYSLGVFLVLLGICVFLLAFSDTGSYESIFSLFPFFVPAIGLFIYLGLTQESTKKPWFKKQMEKFNKQVMDSVSESLEYKRYESKNPILFGALSGAVWILFLIGIIIAIFNLYSSLLTLVFAGVLILLFAVVVQLILVAVCYKKRTLVNTNTSKEEEKTYSEENIKKTEDNENTTSSETNTKE